MEKPKKPKMKKVPLSEEEFKYAVLARDENEMQIAVQEFNVKQAKRAIELGLASRMAERDLAQKEEELVKAKLNKKYYDKLVRNKSKEVPDIK